ncbi:hypothetical protein OGAPHI_001906 [Ogataea philodendri]|uniref:Uncharacterized protein n=1 Tax=Ogataea philodendri TaxID=1378263 RepID=A0A9P8PA81_9ASCO|nr:uncharacterized protein OGAPHI_001906 [Ogataea philodendri]KAH3668152.1 hypothetical protein OGAPHI_001906 [Ogataea philodendri]
MDSSCATESSPVSYLASNSLIDELASWKSSSVLVNEALDRGVSGSLGESLEGVDAVGGALAVSKMGSESGVGVVSGLAGVVVMAGAAILLLGPKSEDCEIPENCFECLDGLALWDFVPLMAVWVWLSLERSAIDPLRLLSIEFVPSWNLAGLCDWAAGSTAPAEKFRFFSCSNLVSRGRELELKWALSWFILRWISESDSCCFCAARFPGAVKFRWPSNLGVCA